MNFGKLVSGIAALIIYLSLIFLVLYFYNIHQIKAKNYVEKNADRVTVTLVNSDKTVFNRKDKTSNPKKPVPKSVAPTLPVPKKVVRTPKHTPKKVIPKRVEPKKKIPKKTVPKKRVPKKTLPKKRVPKKVIAPKKKIPKKKVPKKRVSKKTVPKKVVPKKKIPKKVVPKKRVPKKRVPVVPKKRVPKKTAKDLFSSIKTHPVKKRPIKPTPRRRPVVVERSAIRHNSSFADRIKATHQSGRVSNANREKGVENAYIAKVKRHMMNWHAVGANGQQVVIALTIYQSGKFRYRVVSGVNGSMRSSLQRYLDTLNRIGLGRHTKSTPYSIKVRFRVR
jgi:hypothetical protein